VNSDKVTTSEAPIQFNSISIFDYYNSFKFYFLVFIIFGGIQELREGQSRTVLVEISPNVNSSQSKEDATKMTAPLTVEAAVRCSFDTFVFKVPFDLSAVLVGEMRLGLDVFKKSWTALEKRTLDVKFTPLPRLSPEEDVTSYSQRLVAKLQNANLLVPHCSAIKSSDCVRLLLGACTVNRLTMFADVTVNNSDSSDSSHFTIRTETLPLFPLLRALLLKVLGAPSTGK